MSSSQESKDKCSKFPVHLVIDFLVPQLLTVRKCVTELPKFSCYFGKKKTIVRAEIIDILSTLELSIFEIMF